MLLKSYKDILPASVAFIGGIMLTVGQPEIALANGQGGGSRLHMNVVYTSSQTVLLQNSIL
jgi:hypothetical protein